MNERDPARIMQIGMGFWPTKTFLSAIELELFTVLRNRAMTADEIQEALELHPRGVLDFLDRLLALQLLERDGDGGKAPACYRNTQDTAHFLDKGSPTYIGGFFEMANRRL